MSGEAEERVHGTAIAFGHRAVLIRGPSGVGKSDLALRCLGLSTSALVRETVKLVADDQVILKPQDHDVMARAPATLRGKIEVRGLGILEMDALSEASLVLVADLVCEGRIERYPDPWPFVHFLGFDIPLIRMFPFESSAPLKLVKAIDMAPRPRVAPKA